MLTMNDVNGILQDEMGFCGSESDESFGDILKTMNYELCDVCGSVNSDLELLHNDGACFNCNTQLN